MLLRVKLGERDSQKPFLVSGSQGCRIIRTYAIAARNRFLEENFGCPPVDDLPKTSLGQKQPGNRKIPVTIYTREEAMKKMSVVTMFALFVSLICLGSASVSIAQSNDLKNLDGLFRKKVASVVGSWKGTGHILAQYLELNEIDVVINITKQSGDLFYGTMDVSLTHGDVGISGKNFLDVSLYETTSFSCPIAGNIDPKGNLSISGGTVYKFPFFQTPSANPADWIPTWMMTSLKQEVTASLHKGTLRSILGIFRVAVQPILFIESFEPYLGDPPGAAFSGSFAVQEAPPEMK
jgi:hypothetical protein